MNTKIKYLLFIVALILYLVYMLFFYKKSIIIAGQCYYYTEFENIKSSDKLNVFFPISFVNDKYKLQSINEKIKTHFESTNQTQKKILSLYDDVLDTTNSVKDYNNYYDDIKSFKSNIESLKFDNENWKTGLSELLHYISKMERESQSIKLYHHNIISIDSLLLENGSIISLLNSNIVDLETFVVSQMNTQMHNENGIISETKSEQISLNEKKLQDEHETEFISKHPIVISSIENMQVINESSKFKNYKTVSFNENIIFQNKSISRELSETSFSTSNTYNYIGSTKTMNFLESVVPIEIGFTSQMSFFHTNPNIVKVSGYIKSNGTVVEEHFRTAPNSTIKDNYSTSPNINPFTGKIGTK
jgi:hypothetical protein